MLHERKKKITEKIMRLAIIPSIVFFQYTSYVHIVYKKRDFPVLNSVVESAVLSFKGGVFSSS